MNLLSALRTFGIYNINGINAILYIVKSNILIIIVLAVIILMMYAELKNIGLDYVSDERNIV